MIITNKDRETMRTMARKILELSQTPHNKKLEVEWYLHNELKSTRPKILVHPENAWNEIKLQHEFICENELLREWEFDMFKIIYQMEVIKDDYVIWPRFGILMKHEIGSFGLESVEHRVSNSGSYTWEPAIKDINADFEKLKKRQPKVYTEETKKQVELANSIFGDILEVYAIGQYWWSMGLTGDAIRFLGLENFFMLMYDDPDGLHRLMKFLSDDFTNVINFFENNGGFSLNNGANEIGSGGIALTHDLPRKEYRSGDKILTQDLWGFSESQETVGVSPDMFAEFVLPYQKPLMERYGLMYYGCCESLHERIKYLKEIPNLRGVSVSPWCNQEIMAEFCKKDYVYMRKPNPSLVCSDFNEAAIREDVRYTLNVAGNCNLEFILKDTHTIQNEPWRINRWVEIVREEIAKR